MPGGRSLKGPALGHPANRLLLSQLWSSKKAKEIGREKKKKRTRAEQTNNEERKEERVWSGGQTTV